MSEKRLYEEIRFLILDDDDDIPTPLVINKSGKTVVYWDVADYPVPKDVDDLSSLHRRIESILLELGCQEVSVVVYVYKNRFSDEMERKFMDAKIFVDFLPQGEDDFARMTWILVDIICLPVILDDTTSRRTLCSLRCCFLRRSFSSLSRWLPPASLEKRKEIKEAVDHLEIMYSNGVGVLLSKTEPDWLVPNENSALELTRLFEQCLHCDKPHKEGTLANSLDYPPEEETNVSS
ncbi:unnamed protein product [Eruca vesicaria subsp. sativa]|uniref:NYN domain-containing protein n=1 Tax=Eruca vesicaria subsp. sativa TaxID=29727 RepID=A0ABC8LXY4_ERUVS|nr:unnamed protein product [Eruca vesicaria subsp. sativa]